MQLKNRVALVTGGGGGFGRSISQAFAAEGAKVVVTDVQDSGTEVADSVNGTFIKADISTIDGTRELGNRVLDVAGQVDILVNNAGLQHLDAVEEFPDEEWAKLIQVMLIAPFQLTKAVVPGMKKRGWGRIINLSSIHGLVASPFKSAYISAKHGIVGMTKTIALEVGEFGITVNAICPGYSNTPLVQSQIGSQARTRGISKEEVVEKVMLEPAAIKRLIDPEEIANMAVFLATDQAKSITGASMVIDAGWTAR